MGVMPEWFWFVLAPVCLGAAVVLLRLIWRATRIKIKDYEVSMETALPGAPADTSGCSDTQVALLRRMEQRLVEMYDKLCIEILAYMAHELQIPKDALSNNIDYTFIASLVWQIVYGKNGKKSIRTILEDIIIHRDYDIAPSLTAQERITKRMRIMRNLIAQINGEMQKTFEDKYHTNVTLFNSKTKEVVEWDRSITREQLAELTREVTSDSLGVIIEDLLFEVEV